MTKFETTKEKILAYLPVANSRKDPMAMEIAKEMHDLSPEEVQACWALFQRNTKALFAIHPYIERLAINPFLNKPAPTWEESLANFHRIDQELDKYRKD